MDFADLGLPGVAPPAPAAAPAAASGGGGSKSRKAPAAGAGAAASGGAKQAAAKQASSAAKQQPAGVARQSAGASKAGASRQAAGASKPPAGASKAGSSRPAPSKPSPVTAAVQQAAAAVQQPQAAAAVAAPAAPAPAAQQPARNGKTHHARLQNGLTSHAAAVKQALAAGGRPPYLTGPSLLPRRCAPAGGGQGLRGTPALLLAASWLLRGSVVAALAARTLAGSAPWPALRTPLPTLRPLDLPPPALPPGLIHPCSAVCTLLQHSQLEQR